MSVQETFRQDRRGGAQRPREDRWGDAGQGFRRQDVHSLDQQRFDPQQQRQGDDRQESSSLPVDPGQLATGLGWFSIGLGLAQLVAPAQVAQFIGVEDSDESQSLLRAIGLREIVSGFGILTQPVGRRSDWVKARVGGDVMDLALLGRALVEGENDGGKVTTALVAVAGVTALDLFCSQQLSQEESNRNRWLEEGGEDQQWGSRQALGDQSRQQPQAMPVGEDEKGIHVAKAVTINRSPAELYAFWRDFTNLPRIMSHLESVQVLDGGRSHWKVKAPANTTVEWDAEIIDDQPNHRIAWQSLEDANIRNAGWVRFDQSTGNRGTRVTVELQYEPPLGKLGAIVAKLLGEEPEKQVYDDLRAFKQVMEVGEVTRSDGSPWGPQLAQRRAQPLSDEEIAEHEANAKAEDHRSSPSA